MKGKLIVSVVVASVVVMFTSCKIQDAPGAYQRAKGRITVEVLKQQNENKPEVAPMPTPVVREPEQSKEIAKPQEVVAEPVFVPIPVVESEPTPEPTPAPVVVEEKEVTRAEKFEVVEEKCVSRKSLLRSLKYQTAKVIPLECSETYL